MTMAIKLHKSCSTLSIYAFINMSLKDDYRYLIKGYNDLNDEDKYSKLKQDPKLKKIFKAISYEHDLLTVDKKSVDKLRDELNIAQMRNRYYITQKILDIYESSPNIEVLFLLKDLRWSFDTKKSINEQIDFIIGKMKGLKMRLNIALINYKNKYKENFEKQSHEINLDKDALYLETSLSLGYKINIRKTSVERWVNLLNLSEEKAKAWEK